VRVNNLLQGQEVEFKKCFEIHSDNPANIIMPRWEWCYVTIFWRQLISNKINTKRQLRQKCVMKEGYNTVWSVWLATLA